MPRSGCSALHGGESQLKKKSLIYKPVSVSYYNVISTDLFNIINTETSKTKIFVFHVITVVHYNRLSRINIRSLYNCGSNLAVITDDWSLFRPLNFASRAKINACNLLLLAWSYFLGFRMKLQHKGLKLSQIIFFGKFSIYR